MLQIAAVLIFVTQLQLSTQFVHVFLLVSQHSSGGYIDFVFFPTFESPNGFISGSLDWMQYKGQDKAYVNCNYLEYGEFFFFNCAMGIYLF